MGINDIIQETSPATTTSTSSSQADIEKIKMLEMKVMDQADSITNLEKVIHELRAKIETLETPSKQDLL